MCSTQVTEQAKLWAETFSLTLASGQLCSNPLLGDRYSRSGLRPLVAQAAEGQKHRHSPWLHQPCSQSSRSLGGGQSHKSHRGSRESLSAHGKCVLIVYCRKDLWRTYYAPGIEDVAAINKTKSCALGTDSWCQATTEELERLWPIRRARTGSEGGKGAAGLSWGQGS